MDNDNDDEFEADAFAVDPSFDGRRFRFRFARGDERRGVTVSLPHSTATMLLAQLHEHIGSGSTRPIGQASLRPSPAASIHGWRVRPRPEGGVQILLHASLDGGESGVSIPLDLTPTQLSGLLRDIEKTRS